MEKKYEKRWEDYCKNILSLVPFWWRMFLLGAIFFLATSILASVFFEEYRNRSIGMISQSFGHMGELSSYKTEPYVYVGEAIVLPEPSLETTLTFEEVLTATRSSHEYDSRLLKEEELSQVLYAAQGMRNSLEKERMVPSAYNAYPFSLFVVVRNVEGVEPGVYRYLPETHSIRPTKFSRDILSSQLDQPYIYTAPVIIVFSAEYGKILEKSGGDIEIAKKLSLQESGHISQNIYLQSAALGLDTVVIADFNAKAVRAEIGLPKTQNIVYIQPIGGRVERDTGE